MTKIKHPANRWERMRINEKKMAKRENVKRKREGSNPTVSGSIEDNLTEG